MTSKVAVRFFKTISATILTTLVGYIVQYVIGQINRNCQVTVQHPNKSKLGSYRLSVYEKKIADHILPAKKSELKLADIGGLEEIKQNIYTSILLPLQCPRVFFCNTQSLLQAPKGILLCGPPGTGKTMLAKAIAAEANVPFINLCLSTLENKYFGETNKLLSATFSLARKIQPCIIFFDEIDGMLRTRTDSDQACVYGFKTELLNNMDGLESQKSDAVIVMGCTNHIDALDPALRRRLPLVYNVSLPKLEDRTSILKILTKSELKVPTSLSDVAASTEGFSGSDLAELYRLASSKRLSKMYKNDAFLKRVRNVEDVQELTPFIQALTCGDWNEAIQQMSRNFSMTNENAVIKNEEDSDDEERPPPS